MTIPEITQAGLGEQGQIPLIAAFPFSNQQRLGRNIARSAERTIILNNGFKLLPV